MKPVIQHVGAMQVCASHFHKEKASLWAHPQPAARLLTNQQTSKISIKSLFQLFSSRCQMKYILIMELWAIHLGSLFILA